MTLGQGPDTPLVMDSNYVKYDPDRTGVYEVMARTRCGQQTDGHTG